MSTASTGHHSKNNENHVLILTYMDTQNVDTAKQYKKLVDAIDFVVMMQS